MYTRDHTTNSREGGLRKNLRYFSSLASFLNGLHLFGSNRYDVFEINKS